MERKAWGVPAHKGGGVIVVLLEVARQPPNPAILDQKNLSIAVGSFWKRYHHRQLKLNMVKQEVAKLQGQHF